MHNEWKYTRNWGNQIYSYVSIIPFTSSMELAVPLDDERELEESLTQNNKLFQSKAEFLEVK